MERGVEGRVEGQGFEACGLQGRGVEGWEGTGSGAGAKGWGRENLAMRVPLSAVEVGPGDDGAAGIEGGDAVEVGHKVARGDGGFVARAEGVEGAAEARKVDLEAVVCSEKNQLRVSSDDDLEACRRHR